MIARGSANAGNPLHFGDKWVLMFRRVDDKLQVLRKNIHFTAPAGTPLDKAVKGKKRAYPWNQDLGF